MVRKPIIGVPADRRMVDPHPFHMVGEKYLQAMIDGANALPFIIPVLAEHLDMHDVVNAIDGLFLTGSPSNVEPHHYAGQRSDPGTWHDSHRDATTLPLARKALEIGMPLLAVCRGFQELNVVLGGTLHQKVHAVPGYHRHNEDPGTPLEVQYGPSHDVNLVDGGLLNRLAGANSVKVNSLHSQGVARLAEGVAVEAVADDGLIEAFTVDSAAGFALAVQWHPEWQATRNDFSMAIFEAFGDACRAYAANKRQV
jgi:putative glutamine amidotransferase